MIKSERRSKLAKRMRAPPGENVLTQQHGRAWNPGLRSEHTQCSKRQKVRRRTDWRAVGTRLVNAPRRPNAGQQVNEKLRPRDSTYFPRRRPSIPEPDLRLSCWREDYY